MVQWRSHREKGGEIFPHVFFSFQYFDINHCTSSSVVGRAAVLHMQAVGTHCLLSRGRGTSASALGGCPLCEGKRVDVFSEKNTIVCNSSCRLDFIELQGTEDEKSWKTM